MAGRNLRSGSVAVPHTNQDNNPMNNLQGTNSKASKRIKSSSFKRSAKNSAEVIPKEPPKAVRPNLQGHSARRAYFSEEKQKAIKAMRKTKKWKQMTIDDRNNRNSNVQLEEKKTEKLNIEEPQVIKNLSDELKPVEHDTPKIQFYTPRGKPLYKIMKERYIKNVEIPRQEDFRQQLARIKEMNASVNREEIDNHIHWYNVQKSKAKPQSLPKYKGFVTEKGTEVFKSDKQSLQEAKLAFRKKVKLKQKQKNYARTVKMTHSPQVDKVKSNEIAVRIEKLNNPVTKKLFNSTDRKWKPKKYPVNPMAPVPKEKVEIKPINYLDELKSHRRGQSNLSENCSAEKKIMLAAHLEREAFLMENKMKGSSVKNVQTINNLLLKSVKTKMEVLQNLN